MKNLILTLLITVALPAVACEGHGKVIYFKVGAGYKFAEDEYIIRGQERIYFIDRDPYSARFELGVQQGPWTYGVAHHSQWRTGWPFNDQGEPNKSEIFVDYRWEWRL